MAKLVPLPGGRPVDEGEALVVNHLRDTIPDTYTLIPNAEIAEPGRPPFEYDLIVVAPHAVYVVEVKRWRGGIRGDDHTWFVGGRHRRQGLRCGSCPGPEGRGAAEQDPRIGPGREPELEKGSHQLWRAHPVPPQRKARCPAQRPPFQRRRPVVPRSCPGTDAGRRQRAQHAFLRDQEQFIGHPVADDALLGQGFLSLGR